MGYFWIHCSVKVQGGADDDAGDRWRSSSDEESVLIVR